jgi:hypothetical protein
VLVNAAFASQQALADVALPVGEWRRRLEDSQRELVEAKNLVDILGSEAVRDAADGVLDVLVRISGDGSASYEGIKKRLLTSLTGKTQGGFAAASATHIDTFGDARRALIRTIRHDIEIDP